MQLLLENQVEAVSGGGVLIEFATYAGWVLDAIIGGVQGSRNVMQFTGEDMFLEALRGGNLGA